MDAQVIRKRYDAFVDATIVRDMIELVRWDIYDDCHRVRYSWPGGTYMAKPIDSADAMTAESFDQALQERRESCLKHRGLT